MPTSASILVADDDRGVQVALRRILRKAGHEVVVCGDGVEALEHLETETFDLIITDLSMPDVDGYELITRLRATDREIPVLVITASVSADVIQSAYRAGANGFIEKPFSDAEEIIRRVTEALRRSSERANIAAKLRAANRTLSRIK